MLGVRRWTEFLYDIFPLRRYLSNHTFNLVQEMEDPYSHGVLLSSWSQPSKHPLYKRQEVLSLLLF